MRPDVKKAVLHFWRAKDKQLKKQKASATQDKGNRGAVTAGGHMDGFVPLISGILQGTGIPEDALQMKKSMRVLPGFYRATKQWDLAIVVTPPNLAPGTAKQLLATIELKSQEGSFGNNTNNRVEEALGLATDFWKAFEKGAFKHPRAPWVGFLMLIEDSTKSTTPVKPSRPHFDVFQEFENATYADRYAIFFRKMLRERLFNSACLLLSNRDTGSATGAYREPYTDLGFDAFEASLSGCAHEFVKLRRL